METQSIHGVGGDTSAVWSPSHLDDVWQTATGRLVDVVEVDGDAVVCEDTITGDTIYAIDFSASRLLYRHDVFVGDTTALLKTPGTTLPTRPIAAPTPPRPIRPRTLLVGARRFCRPDQRPYGFDWDWAAMTRVKSIDATQTPTAYKRLRDLGLDWDYSVDLLAPGDDWTAEDEQRAIMSAAYIRGVAAALNIATIVCLGGKVCKAFRAADTRVGDFAVGELQHGYFPVPGPHSRESSFWADLERVSWLRGEVALLMGCEVAS